MDGRPPQGQRLEERTGTRLFWSPEFYDRNYTDKAPGAGRRGAGHVMLTKSHDTDADALGWKLSVQFCVVQQVTFSSDQLCTVLLVSLLDSAAPVQSTPVWILTS